MKHIKKDFPVKFILLGLMVSLSGSSCKNYLAIDPPQTQLVSSAVFTSDKTATAAMTGIYYSMMTTVNVVSINAGRLGALYADEMVYNQTNSVSFTQFNSSFLNTDNSDINSVWNTLYTYIYQSNAVLEGLASSSSVTASVKSQLIGEAKFVRAFCHFYLVNFYGDVPLITGTAYEVNQSIPRMPKSQVYQQIIADLKDAQSLLTENYPTAEKVRVNRFAATALLARVYLYTENWTEAETQASAVIESGKYTPLPAIDNAFLKNSNEAILQLISTSSSATNTFEGSQYIPSSATTLPNYSLTDELVAAFEPGDLRLATWTKFNTINGKKYYYPYKYKSGGNFATVITEYYTILRLSEQYLIRAEARAKQGSDKVPQAVADVNVIRARAGLQDLPNNLTPEVCLQDILKERRTELFFEFANRWLDLRRSGKLDAVMQAQKPLTWKPGHSYWPMPQAQINTNPFLTQDPGYN